MRDHRHDAGDSHDDPLRVHGRRQSDERGECRRCYNARWISAAPGRIGRPIASLDEHRVPCSRCNPDGVLQPEPKPQFGHHIHREDRTA